jgi:hypothetical protein
MMPQSTFGPVNITQGNSAQFVAEFLDSSGNITTPSSATITVTYTNTSHSSQTDTVDMTATGSMFTGTWSSTSANYGLATWQLTSAGSTQVAQSGQLRVLNAEGG